MISSYTALPEAIRIGTNTTHASFSLEDTKGDLIGFDIDSGNEMCKRVQAECTWVVSDPDAPIPSLKTRKIDTITSSFSAADKRQQEIAFSDKLYAADSRLITAKGLSTQLMLGLLRGRHVGVLQESTQKVYTNEIWYSKDVDVVAYASQDLVYPDLAAGRLDVILQDKVATSEDFFKQPVGKDFAFVGPSVKDKKYFGDGADAGLRKDDVELVTAFNKALNELHQDGTYDRMAKRYFDFSVHGDRYVVGELYLMERPSWCTPGSLHYRSALKYVLKYF